LKSVAHFPVAGHGDGIRVSIIAWMPRSVRSIFSMLASSLRSAPLPFVRYQSRCSLAIGLSSNFAQIARSTTVCGDEFAHTRFSKKPLLGFFWTSTHLPLGVWSCLLPGV
jgi:hypothetical protein